jgi:uncharacterized protein
MKRSKTTRVAAVQKAIAKDAFTKVRDMVEQGLSVNQEFKFKPMLVARTMLDYASERGARKTAQYLIAAGADLERGKYYKPLITAVLFGRKDLVRMLLDAGANPNATVADASENDKGITAVMTAAALDDRPDLLELLLKRGANPHLVTKNGGSALGVAVGRRNRRALDRLVAAECRVSGPVLHVPVYNADIETVRVLIRAGADVNLNTRKRGFAEPAPLDTAIQQRGGNIVAEKAFKTVRGTGALRRRDAAENRKCLKVIKELVRAGANLNRITVDKAPLYRAAEYGDIEVVRLLLKAGADPNLAIRVLSWRTEYEDTALHAAYREGFPKVVKALIAAGAKTDRPDSEGRLPADPVPNEEIDDDL